MVLPGKHCHITRLGVGGAKVMFNSVMQDGDIAVDVRVTELVTLVDTGSGALLCAVKRSFDFSQKLKIRLPGLCCAVLS